MILSPLNVELTKVHYYESFRKHRNRHVNQTSTEVADNKININIKRNIFGQKSWTLNVNGCEPVNSSKPNGIHLKWKLISIALSCIIISASVAVYCYLHQNDYRKIIPYKERGRVFIYDQRALNVEQNFVELQRQRDTQLTLLTSKTPPQTKDERFRDVCQCLHGEVCLRTKQAPPECTPVKDPRDPSGCGGLCAVNTQHCRMLDKLLQVFQCVDNTADLKCPFRYHNCGELCIHEERVCDGSIDCADMGDELNCPCNLETHFHCGNATSCLAKAHKCNGIVDCWDRSDEVNCPRRFHCPPEQLACFNSTGCFQREQFCDGRFDCLDKSDEICS